MIGLINNEDAIMIVIDHKVQWILELAWLVAFLAKLGHKRAAIITVITREHLHSMVVEINDEQETSMMVEIQAHRITEHAISIAGVPRANRELDSSIIIKVHLFHFNLSSLSRAKWHTYTHTHARDTRETPSNE